MLKRSYTARALSMEAIAEKIGLSKGFSRTLLKKLTKDGYVLQFQLGGRTLYFLLTEKGVKLSKGIASVRAKNALHDAKSGFRCCYESMKRLLTQPKQAHILVFSPLSLT
jgi:predicted transcriptional regulator